MRRRVYVLGTRVKRFLSFRPEARSLFFSELMSQNAAKSVNRAYACDKIERGLPRATRVDMQIFCIC